MCTVSGGLHNAYRDHEYVDVFKKSLRKIHRPYTSYRKHGGFDVGMTKTPATTASLQDLSKIFEQQPDLLTRC